MPKNKMRFIEAGLATYSVISLCTAGTLAYWRSEGFSENRITTGILDGTIVENYTKPQGGMYPGDTVEKVVNVRNDGSLDMVVRLKVDKAWIDSGNVALDSEKILIDFDNTNWLDGNDGYYYYKGILKPGQTTAEPLMDSFSLDRSASNEYMYKEASIVVSMECLQATSNAIEDVWGISYEELGIDKPQIIDIRNASVEFTDERTFIFNFNAGNDLFTSFKNLTPGETRYQTIDIINNSKEQIEMFLSTRYADAENEVLKSFLREYVVLTITDENGNVVYNGAADGSTVTGEISIGVFEAGETHTLNVALSFNPQAGNTYQNINAQNIQWVFTVQGDDEEITGIPDSGSPSTPITGDNSKITFWIAANGIVSALIAILLWLLGKEKKEDKEKV